MCYAVSMQTCGTCGVEKNDEDFHWKVFNSRRSNKCKQCAKEYKAKYYKANTDKIKAQTKAWREENGKAGARYRLSNKEFAELFDRFDGKCWLCRLREAKVIDHDHACCPGDWTCGKCVRGALCVGCNTRLGWYERVGQESISNYLAV